jgi:hypothetical protein
MSDFLLRAPEALALALPAFVCWWLWFRRGSGRAWRLALLLLLCLAAARPELAWLRGGSDVLLVLDRSQSMGEARSQQEELLTLAGDQREAGDRLGVVVVGAAARVAQPPAGEGVPRLGDHPVSEDASELGTGLEYAASLLTPGRSARLLLVTDGETTGPAPRRVAAALGLAGVPIDVLPVTRPPLPDAAVADVDLPAELRAGESFLGSVTFRGESPSERAWKLVRLEGGERLVIASGKVRLDPGKPVVVPFADRPATPGVARYEVDLEATEDRVPENNLARASLRVAGGERVLLVGGDGTPGNLARALTAAGLEVVTRAEGPVALGELLGFTALVLEQVPAGELGLDGMTDIATWVEHMGGGLVLTGGRRSFGAGGYHRSAVERVLPVTMELRDEHRKLAVALAVSLDRSGSMAVPAADGRPKMQLANSGAMAAIELLGPQDEVAVHAVDERPHVIISRTQVSDAGELAGRVRGIRSEGGGIFVYEALKAAGAELAESKLGTRHLVLFADATDAEEPGDYQTLLAAFVAAGITVSVIGMGTRSDPDGALLEDIAKRGGGRVWFANRAEDLPRVFAQETLLVARTAWVDGPVAPVPRAALVTVLGGDAAGREGWPPLGGYNLTYLRPRAEELATAAGDPPGPAIATWRVGTGRSVAITFDVDDPESQAWPHWEGYGPTLAGLVRWAGGRGESAPGVLAVERHGRRVRLTLELDPAERDRWPARAPEVVLARAGELGEPRRLPTSPVDEGRYEAVLTLDDAAPVIPAVSVGDSAILGPALQVPYSPEFEPRPRAGSGLELCEALARDSGGAVRQDLAGLFENPPSAGQHAELAPWLLALALLILVGEIAVRRMRLGLPARAAMVPRGSVPPPPRPPPTAAAVAPAPAPPPAAALPPLAKDRGLHEALRRLRRGRKR